MKAAEAQKQVVDPEEPEQSRQVEQREFEKQAILDFKHCLVTILVRKKNTKHAVRAMNLIIKYLQSDMVFYEQFEPTRELLRSLNMEPHILSLSPSESESALHLCSFIMRYNRRIDIVDFSDHPNVIFRLRRYDNFEMWAQIESL